MKKILLLSFFFFLSLRAQTPNLWSQYYGSLDFYKIIYTSDNVGYIAMSDSYYGDSGRLIKTTDGGKTYKEITLFKNGIEDVFFCDDKNGFLVNNYYAYKTTDGGATWNKFTINGISYGFFRSFYFINKTVGFIITSNPDNTYYIYRTEDGGNNWNLLNSVSGSEIIFVDENTGWAINKSTGELYKTEDSGVTWILQYTVNPLIVKSLKFTDAKNGWFLASNPSVIPSFTYMYRTTDGGSSWYLVNSSNIPFDNIEFANASTGIAKNSSGIYSTTDGGMNWNKKLNFSIYDFSTSIYKFNSKYYFLATNGLIAESKDGNSWDLNTRIGIEPSFSLTTRKLESDDNFLYFVNQGMRYTTNQSEYFITKIKRDGSAYEAIYTGIPVTNSNETVSKFYSNFKNTDSDWYLAPRPYKSINNGESWEKLFDKSNPATNYQFFTIQFFDKYKGIALSKDSKIYKTNNSGTSWQMIKDLITDYYYTDFHFFDENNGIIINENNQILKTYNGGLDWSIQYSDTYEHRFRKLYFLNQNIGFAIRGNKIMKTSDGGENWSLLNTPEAEGGLYVMDLYFLNPTVGWIASINGIFKTTNGGATWIKEFDHSTDLLYMYDENSGYAMYDKLLFTYKKQPLPTYLINPENNQENAPINVILKWEKSQNADGYYISLGKTTAYELLNKSITNNNFLVLDFLLESNTSYNLKVVPYNSANEAVDNIIFHFKTGSSMATSEISKNKIEIFPNPVKNILNISNTKFANFKIYDVSGKLIKSGNTTDGKIEVSTFTKGLYIIHIDNAIKKFIKE